MKSQRKFLAAVNRIIRKLDFRKLEQSCNSYEQSYAREVLRDMHQAFLDSYGTDFLRNSDKQYVSLPAVLRSGTHGTVTLGLVVIDTRSSGKLSDAVIFTSKGAMQQRSGSLSDSQKRYLLKKYIPYDYWYTPEVLCDSYINYEIIPARVHSLLRSCTDLVPAGKAAITGGR